MRAQPVRVIDLISLSVSDQLLKRSEYLHVPVSIDRRSPVRRDLSVARGKLNCFIRKVVKIVIQPEPQQRKSGGIADAERRIEGGRGFVSDEPGGIQASGAF